MKKILIVISAISIIVLLAIVIKLGFVYWIFSPPDTKAIAEGAVVSEITALDSKPTDYPRSMGYGYDKYEFFSIPSLALRQSEINTVVNGQFPAFKYQGATFVVLDKWVNRSRGIVTGNVDITDPELSQFKFTKLKNNMYYWYLNLNND